MLTPTDAPLPSGDTHPVRVLVAAHHHFFRAGLAGLLGTAADLAVVGLCDDASQVAGAKLRLRPHVILMDLRMAAVAGLGRLAELDPSLSHGRVVMMTSRTGSGTVAAAHRGGAAGLLVKGSGARQVLDAVRQVARGGTAWPEDLAAPLYAARPAADPEDPAPVR